jgi:dienelactone hydrolase
MFRSVLWVLSVLASPAAFAVMQAQPVEWTEQDVRFSGVLVFDDAGPRRPGLLMVPNWMGVTDSAVDKAKAVAGRGYVVLVADVYGSGKRPADPAEASAMTAALYGDRPLLRARAAKALQVLRDNAAAAPLEAGRIGAFGFCFGGAVVLELARSGAELAGVVSLHGALDTSLPAEQDSLRAALLVLNGADDSYVSAEHIAGFQNEMTAAGADWQFVNFSGAVHCFAEADANRPPGCVYHERSARRAYRMMDAFLAEVFAD